MVKPIQFSISHTSVPNITNSMDQSLSWEVNNSHSADQDIFHFHGTQRYINYLVHNSLPLVLVPCKVNPVHILKHILYIASTPKILLYKTNFNIILPFIIKYLNNAFYCINYHSRSCKLLCNNWSRIINKRQLQLTSIYSAANSKFTANEWWNLTFLSFLSPLTTRRAAVEVF
jgi:hypothetical protein